MWPQVHITFNSDIPSFARHSPPRQPFNEIFELYEKQMRAEILLKDFVTHLLGPLILRFGLIYHSLAMPEPVITLISGVTAIVTNVWKVSKDLYDLIEGIRNAPNHVRVVMVDVHGLYIVLGALQGVLPNVDARRLRTDLVPIFESLQLNLNNCCSILIELSRKLNRYTNAAGEISKSKWMAFRWQFTEKDVKDFRDHLSAYKMTVQLAISTANFANSTQNIGSNERIGTEMEQMRAQVDGIAFNQDLLGRSDAGDHGSVSTDDTDRGFALKRFLMTTESVFSGSPPGSPGMTGNRKGSVSLPPRTFGAEPLHNNGDLEDIKSIKDGASLNRAQQPFSWETESRSVDKTQRGGIRATSRRIYQNILPEENLEVSQPAQDPETLHGSSEYLSTPHNDISVSTIDGPNVLIQQADTRVHRLELESSQQDGRTQYRRQKNNLPDLHAFHISRRSLAREYTFLDRDGDDHLSRRPKPSARSATTSEALRGPQSTTDPVHTQATLSPIQENYPGSIPSYASSEEDYAAQSQAPSLSTKEYPFLTTKTKAPAPDVEESGKIKTVDINSQMDHLTVQEAQRTAGRNEEKILSLGDLAAAAPAKFHLEQVARYALSPRIEWDEEYSLQKSGEELEALEPISKPMSPPLSDSPMGYSYGDELSEATYHDIQQRHPFDDNFGATKIVYERSSDRGYQVLAGSEQTSEVEERIHPGDEFDAKREKLSHCSLPEDGNPVTIATRRKTTTKEDARANKSQTSLLIEYFEGGKGSQAESRRPSVRVKVTPSSKSRKRSSNDNIQISERKGTLKPSYTKESLVPPGKGDKVLEGNGDDNNSARPNPISRRDSPIEVEIMPRRVRNPSMLPEVASPQRRKHNQRSGSHEERLPPSISNKPPTLQEDVQTDVAEKPAGEVSTHEPEIAARKRPSSKSSIKDPKRLETVEDAIRRLILPELTALKREQGKK